MSDFNIKPEEVALNPIQPVSDDFNTDGYLNEFARVDHQHPLSESLRAAIFTGTGQFVKKAGDTMTGSLTVPAMTATGLIQSSVGGEGIRFAAASGYIAWFNGGVREGYLQGNSNGMVLNSENGQLLSLLGTGCNWAGGRFDFGGNNIQGIAAISLSGNINFGNANAVLSAGSYLQFPGGIYISGGLSYHEANIRARGGVSNDSGAGAPGVRINGSGGNYASGWAYDQVQVCDTSGAQHSSCCFYTGPTAPMLRAYGPFGERIDFLNNPNTAYCQICAGAFTVQSSQRIKQDIVRIEDERLLEMVSEVSTHQFLPKTRPMILPLTDRFMDINARWVARGKYPLTPTIICYEIVGEPHDCDNPKHNCHGAPDHPCPVTVNDTRRYGIIAEHLQEYIPEAVCYGEDNLPEGYDVDQIAAMAFGSIGAVVRYVAKLEARIGQLESQNYYLKEVA